MTTEQLEEGGIGPDALARPAEGEDAPRLDRVPDENPVAGQLMPEGQGEAAAAQLRAAAEAHYAETNGLGLPEGQGEAAAAQHAAEGREHYTNDLVNGAIGVTKPSVRPDQQ